MESNIKDSLIGCKTVAEVRRGLEPFFHAPLLGCLKRHLLQDRDQDQNSLVKTKTETETVDFLKCHDRDQDLDIFYQDQDKTKVIRSN